MKTRTSTTVAKAFKILELFLDHTNGLTVTQISNLSQINMSTVVRLCATLERGHYLRRNNRGVYFLGYMIERLAHVYRLQCNIEDIVRPFLKKLRDETGESASFYIRVGDDRQCLFREDSAHMIRHVVEEGSRLPLSAGVVGPLLQAFSGEKGSDFDKIRSAGYLDKEGRESFTASVAVPVHRQDGSLAGALVVSGLSKRFTVRKRNATLKTLLGYAEKLKADLPVTDIRY